jgi:hypothetical protein
MASVRLMHNLSMMMVFPASAGDASGVRMHAYKTYSEFCIYTSMNVLNLVVVATNTQTAQKLNTIIS